MTLTDYLIRGKYELVANHLDSYTAIIDHLNIDLNKPQIIGIDGPTNSGKTTFALAFSHWLNIQGKKGTVIHGDSFLIDRNQRNDIFNDIRQGNITIQEYSKLAWQQDNLRDLILSAKLVANGDRTKGLMIKNAYNRQTGKNDAIINLTIESGSLIIVESVGLHLYQSDLFDITIWVDVNNATTLLDRVFMRELQKPEASRMSFEYLKARFYDIDIPHGTYLRTATAGKADYILDTTELNSLVLYKKP